MSNTNSKDGIDGLRNEFGGRFTNMQSQLQSDIYDIANGIENGVVLIKYEKLEQLIKQYGIQERIDELTELRTSSTIVTPRAYKAITERITALKDKQENE